MDRVIYIKLNQMTQYINSRKYWHESCKNKGSQLYLKSPHPSLCSGWWWTL